MKFFLDANIPYSVLMTFQKLNLEAVHARDAGLSRAADKEIFLHAARSKSILVTKDLEFGNTKIFPVESHYGVIVLRLPSVFNKEQFSGVLKNFLNSVNTKDLEGTITIVKLGKYRIRKIK